MAIKLGLYTHFKQGNRYIVYDVTTDEITQAERISYISCKDKKKHSRFVSAFFEDVTNHPENKTGQKQRFQREGSLLTFTTPYSGDSFKDFLEKNSLPLPFEIGDRATYKTEDPIRLTGEDTIVGITERGLFVDNNGVYILISWAQIMILTMDFNKRQ